MEEYDREKTSSAASYILNGLIDIKQELNRQITPENVKALLNNEDIFEGLIKIFNVKDYNNRPLFALEEHME